MTRGFTTLSPLFLPRKNSKTFHGKQKSQITFTIYSIKIKTEYFFSKVGKSIYQFCELAATVANTMNVTNPTNQTHNLSQGRM